MSVFKDYATSTAFSISLSRSMCEAMEFVKAESLARSGMRQVGALPMLTTMHSLNRRGLVSHNERHWILTEAGEALYPLLVLAGLCRSEEEILSAVRAA